MTLILRQINDKSCHVWYLGGVADVRQSASDSRAQLFCSKENYRLKSRDT